MAAAAHHLEAGAIQFSDNTAGATNVTVTVTGRVGGGNPSTVNDEGDIGITFPAGFDISTATLSSITKNGAPIAFQSTAISGQRFDVIDLPGIQSVGDTFVLTIVGVTNATTATPMYAPWWTDNTLSEPVANVAYSDSVSAINAPTSTQVGMNVYQSTPGGYHTTGGNIPFNLDGIEGAETTFTIVSGALPSGLAISYSTVGSNRIATISGTPSNPGESYSFVLRAENSVGAAGDITFSGTISAEVTWADSTLAPFVRDVPYSDGVSAGGNPAPTYSIASGALPLGLTLDPTTGAITGTPQESGPYSFSIEATNSLGTERLDFSGSVADLPPVEVTAASDDVFFSAGQTVGITFSVFNPGPVDIASLSVESPQIGNASCASSSLPVGATTICTASYVITAADVERGSINISATVIGDGQVRGSTSVVLTLGSSAVEEAHEAALPAFVAQRQSLIASHVYFPGLGQRTRGAGGLTGSGNSTSGVLAFSGSLIQASSGAANAAETLADGTRNPDLPFNLWIEAVGTWHENDRRGSSGTFALASVGGDYLVNDRLLVGAALHSDWMYDRTDDQMISGTGYLVGPYVSAEIVDGVILDAGLFVGRSTNDTELSVTGNDFTGQFETGRVVFDTIVRGEWTRDALTVRPNVAFHISHETADGYTVSGPGGSEVAISGFDSTLVRGTLGATFEYDIDLGAGLTLTPDASFAFGVGNGGGSGIFSQGHGSLSAGFTLAGDTGWSFSSDVRVSGDTGGSRDVSVRGKLGVSF